MSSVFMYPPLEGWVARATRVTGALAKASPLGGKLSPKVTDEGCYENAPLLSAMRQNIFPPTMSERNPYKTQADGLSRPLILFQKR